MIVENLLLVHAKAACRIIRGPSQIPPLTRPSSNSSGLQKTGRDRLATILPARLRLRCHVRCGEHVEELVR